MWSKPSVASVERMWDEPVLFFIRFGGFLINRYLCFFLNSEFGLGILIRVNNEVDGFCPYVMWYGHAYSLRHSDTLWPVCQRLFYSSWYYLELDYDVWFIKIWNLPFIQNDKKSATNVNSIRNHTFQDLSHFHIVWGGGETQNPTRFNSIGKIIF